MEGKTRKPRFNKASGFVKLQRHSNYAHKHLIQKIDHYAHFAKTAQQQKDMLSIKAHYVVRKEQLQRVRYGQRTSNYLLGIRTGIHPKSTLERLGLQDKQQDQRTRNHTAKDAKNYYHRNYSLSKSFKETLNRTKSKERDKDMDRG